MIYILSNQERDTILAALRFYQQHTDAGLDLPPGIAHIATGEDEHDPLVGPDIDDLCVALNGGVSLAGDGRDLSVEIQKILSGAREIERLIQQTFTDPVVEEGGEDDDGIVVEEG